jgi:hypothetical protein
MATSHHLTLFFSWAGCRLIFLCFHIQWIGQLRDCKKVQAYDTNPVNVHVGDRRQWLSCPWPTFAHWGRVDWRCTSFWVYNCLRILNDQVFPHPQTFVNDAKESLHLLWKINHFSITLYDIIFDMAVLWMSVRASGPFTNGQFLSLDGSSQGQRHKLTQHM